MIVLRTPKGWTGPKVVDGKQVEGSMRAHTKCPSTNFTRSQSICACWKSGCEAIKPERAYSIEAGRLKSNWQSCAAQGSGVWDQILMPTAVSCSKDLRIPDYREYAVAVPQPGAIEAEATRVIWAVFCGT